MLKITETMEYFHKLIYSLPMFDAHAHIGDTITEDVLVCTSKVDEYFIVKNYPYHAYGLLSPLSEDALDTLVKTIKNDKRCMIGEFGVDRRFDDRLEDEVLHTLLSLAEETGKPFTLHKVGRTDKLLKALSSYRNLPPFIVHGYTGSIETARELMKRGGIISLGPGGVKTKHFQKLLSLPFLIETDMAAGFEQQTVLENMYKDVAKAMEISVEELVEKIDAGRAVFTS